MIKKLILKYGGEWIFLIIVILLYFLVGIFKLELVWQSLINFKDTIYQIMPIFILVFGLIFFANIFLTQERVLKYLGKKSKVKNYFLAVVFGILSSGPIYMWYPLLADLKDKGVSNDVLAIFLYNRAVKIPLIPMIVYYFGLPFLMIMSLLMVFFSILNGLVINKLVK